MWWMFKKLSDTDPIVLYAYSRGCRKLDGEVSINRDNGEIKLVRASVDDESSEYAKQVAVIKARHMIEQNYPDHSQIACG